jgi:hypothetical protein
MHNASHVLWVEHAPHAVLKMASGGDSPLDKKLEAEADRVTAVERRAEGPAAEALGEEAAHVEALLAQAQAVERSLDSLQSESHDVRDAAGFGELADALTAYGTQYQRSDLGAPDPSPTTGAPGAAPATPTPTPGSATRDTAEPHKPRAGSGPGRDATVPSTALGTQPAPRGAGRRRARAQDAQAATATRSVTARLRDLKGTAKQAKWVSPKQGEPGPGLRDHYDKHGEEVGAASEREYDLSARLTIQNGRRFRYRDRASGEPRVGYWDPSTALFTATSETRGTPAILSHFPETWDNLRKLPGFTGR